MPIPHPSENANIPSPLLSPGTRHTTFTDNEGRTLSKGDFIRVEGESKRSKFKIRHLFRTPNGTCWIDCYGPYDRFNKAKPKARYRSFRVDQIAAKCR